ncbi:MAG TPA: right-handed parallel beta-helix repeat-containing protein [Lysobacter sp.]
MNLLFRAGALALALLLGSFGIARAETYHTCAGFIDSLPATITTQGVWCLRKDLSTAMTSGSAITIATNNVTIDCNGFKVGGLAAGDTSGAAGIRATNRYNATVRHCGVRGFFRGVFLEGGAGHLVEDNRLDQNLAYGIVVTGDNNRVQRNRVYDTGGYPNYSSATGISAHADVIDNTVEGVYGTAATTYPIGIAIYGTGREARGNLVRVLSANGAGQARGIGVAGNGITVVGNRLLAEVATTGWGIEGGGASTFCIGNSAVNFATAFSGCEHQADNLPAP